MGKKSKNINDLPKTVFVQRLIEGTDDPYLLAWDSVEDVDLENGPIVGVYELVNLVSVSEAPRVMEVI